MNNAVLFFNNSINLGNLKFTINTTLGTGNSMTIPVLSPGFIYNYSVNWGDGIITTGHTTSSSHNYASGGIYQIEISGVFPKFYFNNSGDRLKLQSIDNWGSINYDSVQNGAFRGCSNLSTVADDMKWINNITDANFMFYGTKLTTLPTGVTFDNLINANSMFELSKMVTFPLGVTFGNLKSGNSMLYQVPTFVNFPASVSFAKLENGLALIAGTAVTDLPEAITFPKLNSALLIFNGLKINTVRYSKLLNDMASLNTVNSVTFTGGTSKYNSGAANAKSVLTTAPRSWYITDAGLE